MKDIVAKRLKDVIDNHRLEGVLITSLENIRYLSGFTGTDAMVLITPTKNFFFTDFRFITQAKDEITGFIIEQYEKVLETITRSLKELKVNKIGVEGEHISFGFYRRMMEILPDMTVVPLTEELGSLRVIKEKGEMDLIREAIRISSESFSSIIKEIKQGVKEKEIKFGLECQMKKNGADHVAFDLIVASGIRSALPHGVATQKSLELGDFVIIDFGVNYQGYNSDETCTFVMGKAKPEQKKVYKIVKDAHDKAIEAIKPGKKCSEIDAVARDYIERAGYGNYFGHALGHGVGLDVHEEPRISQFCNGVITEGMVFTVEPGIYIPNWGGVRIEDMILVNSTGCDTLTYISKELQEI